MDEAKDESASRHRSTPEELGFIARLRAGDDSAFSELIERYHGAMIRLACIFVSSRAVAEEVVQETWTGVIEGLPAFEGRSSLKTWIFRILSNRAQTRGTKEGRSVPFSAVGDPRAWDEPAVNPARFSPRETWVEPPHRWDEDTPEKLVLRQEALRVVERALETLPPNQRAVLTLRDIDGLDSLEVCNVLRIGETNQRVLLHRARSKLRRALEEYIDGV